MWLFLTKDSSESILRSICRKTRFSVGIVKTQVKICTPSDDRMFPDGLMSTSSDSSYSEDLLTVLCFSQAMGKFTCWLIIPKNHLSLLTFRGGDIFCIARILFGSGLMP